jgi:hypothetical protein
MANENTSNGQKPTAPTTTPNDSGKTPLATAKRKNKNNRPQIGGTAVAGAKSTQPRQVSQSNDPNKQQAESYNRTMRRRMEHIGTGPQTQENRIEKARNQRQKRIERAKERRAAAQKELNKSMGGFRRKNLYLYLGTAAVIVILIVIVVVLHQLHIM